MENTTAIDLARLTKEGSGLEITVTNGPCCALYGECSNDRLLWLCGGGVLCLCIPLVSWSSTSVVKEWNENEQGASLMYKVLMLSEWSRIRCLLITNLVPMTLALH